MGKKETRETGGFPTIHETVTTEKNNGKEENAALLDFLFGGASAEDEDDKDADTQSFAHDDEKERKVRELKEHFRQKAAAYTEETSRGGSPRDVSSDGRDTPSADVSSDDEDVSPDISHFSCEDIQQEDMFADFDRNSVRTEAIRRSVETEEPEEETEIRSEGYMPPLPLEYTPNMQISMENCVFSMFIGEICEEDDPKKYEIYFMVAPFEIRENEPSCNILMYAYFKNQNYSVTSPLTNDMKNSILCQIAEFQFLIRGSFKDGAWSSDIQLTGTSLRRNDIFDIKKSYHHNAKKTDENGHIRFTYDGYINHKEITSVGSVDAFPMDIKGNAFVVVRCMEDFTDIFYTDEPVPIELKTTEGHRILSVFREGNTITAKLDDFLEAGGEADSE